MKTRNNILALVLFAIVALLGACFVTGCASLTSFLQSPTGRIVEKLALNAAMTYAGGGNLDKSWAISEGLFAISGSIPLGEPGAKVIQQAAIDYAGTNDVNTRKLAGDLANAWKAANPTTPATAKETALSLAHGVNSANVKAAGQRHD